MSFYRFGHLSRKQIGVMERALQKELTNDVKSVLENTNGGRFDCNCEHPIFVNDLNAEIQINVLYGLRKNERENICYWNHKYRHQIPENAVIIGDTINHGFIVRIDSIKKDGGIYYWDASYDFKFSNEVANAYYIADSMGKMFETANVALEEHMDVEFLSVFERFSQWKKRISRYLSCRKKLREYDADFLQQKRHKSNMFERFEDTYTYNIKYKGRSLIEEFGELVGYEFSEFFKKFAIDNLRKGMKKPYCLSENGLKVYFERLLGLGHSLEIDIWDVNLIRDDKNEDYHELNKEFVIFAISEENYIAINKSDNYIALLDSEGLFIDKIADNFESFVASLCDEEEIKRRENRYKINQAEMKWENIEPLESEELIDEFEELREYKFPAFFREFVIKNNGGVPEYNIFDTEDEVERVFKSLFTFNKNTKKFSVWDALEACEIHLSDAIMGEDDEWMDACLTILDRYVLFAGTSFGDNIAFDKTDDSIVYINHETFEIEKIADSFDEFLDCLYDDDDDI